MKMSFRWFGPDDSVRLEHIRQIPGVQGIVSSVAGAPSGEAWTRDALEKLRDAIEAVGLEFSVVESIPVHEDIKLGRDTRDKLIDNYNESIRQVGAIGVPVVCYNFMPIFDWTRTSLARPLPDGSTSLSYDDSALQRVSLSNGTGELPGWAAAYDGPSLGELLKAWSRVDEEQLWENFSYFIERVVPAAESAGVRLAIHPDDPPWPIFGLPRIITNIAALRRVVDIVDSPANGLTICTGSLGALDENDLPSIVREMGARGRINFMHCRNVKRESAKSFYETAHPTRFGDVDMKEVMRALVDTRYSGPMRPDHGRNIWGEDGRPGYGLHDRALGATYLQGLWEGLTS